MADDWYLRDAIFDAVGEVYADKVVDIVREWLATYEHAGIGILTDPTQLAKRDITEFRFTQSAITENESSRTGTKFRPTLRFVCLATSVRNLSAKQIELLFPA